MQDDCSQLAGETPGQVGYTVNGLTIDLRGYSVFVVNVPRPPIGGYNRAPGDATSI